MTPAGAWIDAGCFVADAVGALLPSTLSAMRIQCPNCPAAYELDDGRVPPAGLSIKCPKCKTPFTVHRPKPGERKAVTSKVPLPGTGPRLGTAAVVRAGSGGCELRLRRRAAADAAVPAATCSRLLGRFSGAARFRRRATQAGVQARTWRASSGHRAGFRAAEEGRQEAEQEGPSRERALEGLPRPQ